MGVGMRLDQVDEALLSLMQKVNVEKVIPLGIESGSERILQLMRKNSNLALVREKVRLMDSMGFKPGGYFIIGYPTETREEILQTVRLALELPLHQAAFANFLPLPGTPATRMLQENGELPLDFDFAAIDGAAVPYAPKGMTPAELQSLKRWANIRFYLRPRIFVEFLLARRNNWVMGIKRLVRLFRNNANNPEQCP
jgi:radical SAM superfamily enzyme YgiQ (UPF0313 family)